MRRVIKFGKEYLGRDSVICLNCGFAYVVTRVDIGAVESHVFVLSTEDYGCDFGIAAFIDSTRQHTDDEECERHLQAVGAPDSDQCSTGRDEGGHRVA